MTRFVKFFGWFVRLNARHFSLRRACVHFQQTEARPCLGTGLSMSLMRKRIVALVEEYWLSNKTALLPSLLGSIVVKEFPGLRAELGKLKLVAFVEQNMSDQITVLRDPNGRCVGLLPSSVAVPAEAEELNKLIVTKEEVVSGPAYHPNVWKAFTEDLAPDHRRFLLLEGNVSSLDLAKRDAFPPDANEVGRNFIVPIGAGNRADRVKTVHRNILDWMHMFVADTGGRTRRCRR